MKDILLLHPGEMGTSIGACLVEKGKNVLWVAEGRSDAPAKRASTHGFSTMQTMEKALESSDVIMSICPPEHALELAHSINAHGFEGIYVDGNAISPDTSMKIVELMTDHYVDGGIVGPPAWKPDTMRFFMSGARASAIAEIFSGTNVQAVPMSTQPGKASALKMAYAAYTKGSAALLLGVVALAEHHGVFEHLKGEWGLSIPGMNARAEGSALGTSGKAWRFVGEMMELEQTFRSAELPSGFYEAAAQIYQRLEVFKDQPQELAAVVSELLGDDRSDVLSD